jgi:hypothetical protein
MASPVFVCDGATREWHGGQEGGGVSSVIEDRPKIEVLSWRVATYSPTHGTIGTSHTPFTKSSITPLKNLTQTTKVLPTKAQTTPNRSEKR